MTGKNKKITVLKCIFMTAETLLCIHNSSERFSGGEAGTRINFFNVLKIQTFKI